MDYIKESKTLERVFAFLPQFNCSGVYDLWRRGELLCPGWINVPEHMGVSAVLGFRLASLMGEALKAEKTTVLDCVHALLVHDWAKRLESETPRIVGPEQIVDAFSEKVAMLAFATGNAGVATITKRPFTLGEKIIFYSDYCTADTCVVPFALRLARLQKHFEPGGRYAHAAEYYQKRYGMNHNEKITQILSPVEGEFIVLTGGQPENFPTGLVPQEFRQ